MRQVTLFCTLAIAFFGLSRAEIVYPQLAVGGRYHASVLVSNQTGLEWRGTLRALTGNAEPWSLNWTVFDENSSQSGPGTEIQASELALTVPARATRKVEIRRGGDLAVGCLVLQAGSGSADDALAVSFFYSLLSENGMLEDSTGIPTGQKATSFSVAVEASDSVDTGIAWASSASMAPFDLHVSLSGLDGQLVAEKDVPFEGHKAQFFTELFGSVPAGFLGSLTVVSPKPIYLTAIRLEMGGRIQLTSVPPQAAPRKNPLKLVPGSLYAYSHPNGWVHIVSGRVMNTASEDAQFPQIAVVAYDDGDQMMDGSMTFVLGGTSRSFSGLSTNSIVRAGDTGYFSVMFVNPIAPVSFDVLLWASHFENTTALEGNATVTGYQFEQSVTAELTVQIQNTGTRTVRVGYIDGYLLDEQGRIIGDALGKPEAELLAPGESGTVKLVSSTATEDVADVIFSVNFEDVEDQAPALTSLPQNPSLAVTELERLRDQVRDQDRMKKELMDRIRLRGGR